MEKEVINVIGEVLEIDTKDIKGDTNLLADLDLESLDFVDLVTAFEEKYEIEILDKDVKNLQTVNDIVKYINDKK